MTIKNWKKTSDRTGFEAWHNATQEILITLSQELPHGKTKKWNACVHYANGRTHVDNFFDKKEEANTFIATFQKRNI